jgi:hypothetical protein
LADGVGQSVTRCVVFEGYPDLRPVGFNLALRDHQVLLDDFRYAQLAQGTLAASTAALAAFSQGSVLVPIILPTSPSRLSPALVKISRAGSAPQGTG